jgi:Fe-S-cluster containining protein
MPKLDCQACGICCWSFDETPYYCNVSTEEAKNLGRWGKQNIVKIPLNSPYAWVGTVGAIKTKWREMENGPLAGKEILTCVALQGNILYRVQCSIYAKRPFVCQHIVNPGDAYCLKARELVNKNAKDYLKLGGGIRNVGTR